MLGFAGSGFAKSKGEPNTRNGNLKTIAEANCSLRYRYAATDVVRPARGTTKIAANVKGTWYMPEINVQNPGVPPRRYPLADAGGGATPSAAPLLFTTSQWDA